MSAAAPAIRPESQSDIVAIHAVEVAAFGGGAEATLVDALRDSGDDFVSLVASVNDEIVGHICFSRVAIEGTSSAGRFSALAPLAVVPAHQRRGLGSMLVRTGLDACRQRGVDAVFVVGDPAYYSRFGFVAASSVGVKCEFEVPDDAFRMIELRAGSVSAGVLRYPAAFHAL
jgi:putative acetyltransferase